jgi:hypothetical protein
VSVDDSECTVQGIVVAVRSASDCTVRLATGEEIVAALDVDALRLAHGRVYNICIGGSVRVLLGQPKDLARLVWVEQPPA